jgi:hypothetical protein
MPEVRPAGGGMSHKRNPRWQYTDSGPGGTDDIVPPGTRPYIIDEIHTIAWSPDPEPGRTPPTQVHMIFKVSGFPQERFVLRLKSKEAADGLIGLLEEYRKAVWG